MKKFRFNYSIPIIILIALVILISGVGVALNVISVVKFVKISTFSAVSYGLLAVFTALLFAESVAIAAYGLYKIKGDFIYACFGFIYTKIDIQKVVSAKVFVNTNKLVLYLDSGKFTVIIISPEKYSYFISEIIKINPNIAYSQDNAQPA